MNPTPEKDKFLAWYKEEVEKGLLCMHIELAPKTPTTSSEAIYRELNQMNDAIARGEATDLNLDIPHKDAMSPADKTTPPSREAQLALENLKLHDRILALNAHLDRQAADIRRLKSDLGHRSGSLGDAGTKADLKTALERLKQYEEEIWDFKNIVKDRDDEIDRLKSELDRVKSRDLPIQAVSAVTEPLKRDLVALLTSENEKLHGENARLLATLQGAHKELDQLRSAQVPDRLREQQLTRDLADTTLARDKLAEKVEAMSKDASGFREDYQDVVRNWTVLSTSLTLLASKIRWDVEHDGRLIGSIPDLEIDAYGESRVEVMTKLFEVMVDTLKAARGS